jgi:hypothetical protein
MTDTGAGGPRCPYCGLAAVWYADSALLYHGRDYGPAWVCPPCGAWVGVHKGTDKPLGRLADAELRRAKMAAHAAFDPLWQARQHRSGLSQGHARGKGYKWLAGELGLAAKDCHIGMLDVETCHRVVAICAPYLRPRPRD